jgi:hypothetical protein
MPKIPEEFLFPVQAALEQWTDQRVIRDDALESLLLFECYLHGILYQSGVRLDGYVFRQKQGQWLLTIKAHQGETPLVVFITSDNPTSCRSKFLDLLEDERLTWVRDKYPWI